MDVDNGLWALYGTRLGCYMTNCTDWDFVNVRDFEWHTKFWNEEVKPSLKVVMKSVILKTILEQRKLWNETVRLGKELRNKLGLQIDDPKCRRSYLKKFIGIPSDPGAFVTEKGTDGITPYKVLK